MPADRGDVAELPRHQGRPTRVVRHCVFSGDHKPGHKIQPSSPLPLVSQQPCKLITSKRRQDSSTQPLHLRRPSDVQRPDRAHRTAASLQAKPACVLCARGSCPRLTQVCAVSGAHVRDNLRGPARAPPFSPLEACALVVWCCQCAAAFASHTLGGLPRLPARRAADAREGRGSLVEHSEQRPRAGAAARDLVDHCPGLCVVPVSANRGR